MSYSPIITSPTSTPSRISTRASLSMPRRTSARRWPVASSMTTKVRPWKVRRAAGGSQSTFSFSRPWRSEGRKRKGHDFKISRLSKFQDFSRWQSWNLESFQDSNFSALVPMGAEKNKRTRKHSTLLLFTCPVAQGQKKKRTRYQYSKVSNFQIFPKCQG